MGRPPLPVGTYGAIRVSERKPGVHVARAAFRDHDGKVRTVQAAGPSAAAARRRLTVVLRDRATPTGLEIGPEMRLTVVGALWLEEVRSEGRVVDGTVESYRQVWVNHVEPALGQLRVREVTVSRVERVIRAISERTPGQVKHARSVLSGVLGMAVRHDALAANPVTSIPRMAAREKKQVVSHDLDTIEAVRRAAHDYRRTAGPDGRRPLGPGPTMDLPDFIDLLLATGGRPGEILALRWSDCDLTATPVTVTICGTIVGVAGRPLSRQPFTKGKKPRTLPVPDFAVEVLRRRQLTAAADSPTDAVIPSRAGTWKDPRGMAKTFRAAMDAAGLDAHVLAKDFRPTVATLVARELDSNRAAAQLGHASDAVTKTYYIRPDAAAPDSRAVLDMLAPRR